MARRRGPPATIDGYAIAHGFPTDRALSLAVYERARRDDRLDEFRLPTHGCATCGRSATLEILFVDSVAHRRRIGCELCVPTTRPCATCQKPRPLAEFDINPSRALGFKFESNCLRCRRERNKAYYHRMQKVKQEGPARIRCTRCNRVLVRKKFFEDGRYVDGVMQPCLACRRELQQEYFDSPEGAPAAERARASQRLSKRRRQRP